LELNTKLNAALAEHNAYKVALILRLHKVLDSKDFFLIMAKFKQLNKLDQVSLLSDTVNQIITTNPEALQNLKRVLTLKLYWQENGQQTS